MKKTKSKQIFDFTDEGDSAPSSFGVIARNNSVQEKLEPNLSQSRADRQSEAADIVLNLGKEMDSIIWPNLSQTEAKLEPNKSQDQKGLLAQLEPNVSQTRVELEPIVSQTEANHKPQLRPNLSQTRAKREPIISQTEVKVEPQREPLHESNLGQTRAKREPKSRDFRNIQSLIGLQRDALFYIFRSCINEGSRISACLAIENMAMSLQTSSAAVRKAIQRLEHDKRFIERYDWKDGRGGWTKYEIFEDIYSQLIVETRANLEPNLGQTRAKVEPQLRPQPEPNVPYSSSDFLNDKKINTIGVPENLKPFGVSAINLQRIVEQGKCPLDVVQKSVEAMSFDVGKGKKGNIANILFGVLNNGREYVSQAHSLELNKELQEELKRSSEAEDMRRQLDDLVMKRKWEEYKIQYPTWVDVYRAKNGFTTNEETLEMIAFEEFKHGAGESD